MGNRRLSLPIKASLVSASIILPPPNPSPKNSSRTSILTSILLSSSSPFSEGSNSNLTEVDDEAPSTSEMPVNGSCLEDMSGFTMVIETINWANIERCVFG